MRYTLKDFKTDYPDDVACLKSVLDNRFGDTCPKCGVVGVKWHPITGRKAFVCSECDKHIYPLADTIFRKSDTSLWNWFYAIFQFSVAKNGVSAKELERTLGVTYKTAWRMCKQIRMLMEQDGDQLSGTVEADETFIGSKGSKATRFKRQATVLGLTERDGMTKAVVASGANASTAIPFMKANVAIGSTVYTDESKIYSRVKRDYEHKSVVHSKQVYVIDDVHTNTIEGFWGNMKRAIDGTYHCVSQKYLQAYVNEFTFRYNFRHVPIYPVLLERAVKLS